MVGPTISHPNPKIFFAVCSLLIFPHPLQNCIVMNGCTTVCLKTKHIWFVRLAWSVALVGRTYHNNIYRFSSASLVVRLRPISAEIVRFPPRSSEWKVARIRKQGNNRLRYVRKVSKRCYWIFILLTSVRIFFLPFADNSVTPGQILVKFYNSGFSKLCPSNSAFFISWWK